MPVSNMFHVSHLLGEIRVVRSKVMTTWEVGWTGIVALPVNPAAERSEIVVGTLAELRRDPRVATRIPPRREGRPEHIIVLVGGKKTVFFEPEDAGRGQVRPRTLRMASETEVRALALRMQAAGYQAIVLGPSEAGAMAETVTRTAEIDVELGDVRGVAEDAITRAQDDEVLRRAEQSLSERPALPAVVMPRNSFNPDAANLDALFAYCDEMKLPMDPGSWGREMFTGVEGGVGVMKKFLRLGGVEDVNKLAGSVFDEALESVRGHVLALQLASKLGESGGASREPRGASIALTSSQDAAALAAQPATVASASGQKG